MGVVRRYIDIVMDQAMRVHRLTVGNKYFRKILWGKLDSRRTEILMAKTHPLSNTNSSLYINAEPKKHNMI